MKLPKFKSVDGWLLALVAVVLIGYIAGLHSYDHRAAKVTAKPFSPAGIVIDTGDVK